MKLIIHHNSIWNKGGAGSGFHGHAGRPGLVGGSQANTSAVRADMISVNELDVITHDDIKSYLDYVKEGTGEENFRYRYEHEFFLGPDGKIYSMNNPVFNGHEQIAKNIIEKKKLDINPYKEDEELAVLNRGYIRMAYAPESREIIIEAIPFRTAQLRMVQDKMLGLNSIVDRVRIDRFRYKVSDGAEKYIRSNDFSYDDFMTSNDVVLVDDEPVRLKEKKAKLRYKGGSGSGFHNHAGRPGLVGGSSSNVFSISPEDDDGRESAFREIRNATKDLEDNPGAQEMKSASRDWDAELLVTKNSDGIPVAAMSYYIKDDHILINHVGSISKGQGTNLIHQVAKIAANKGLGLRADSRVGVRTYWEKIGFDLKPDTTNVFLLDSDKVKKFIIHHNSIRNKGGQGSGFHGHRGIPGHQGGSLPEGSASPPTQVYEKPTKETHAGLIDVKRNPFVKGAYVSIYNAEQAGIDASTGKYADVCEAHGTISNFETLRQAKYHLRAVDWCEECMRIAEELT